MNKIIDQGAYGWHKSSYSAGGPDTQCLEQGVLPDGRVAVRDTKQDGAGPVIAISPEGWAALLRTVA